MCWIANVPANVELKEEYLDRAASINKHGYGVMYYADNAVQVFKTMDFTEFKAKLATIVAYPRVIHLRLTSVGATTINNVHPFDCGNGTYMLHNGTMSSVKCTTSCADASDTRQLADLIKASTWTRISDIQPLIQTITGTAYNKLVFMESDGTITIINKNLGNEENGIWFSNEYHIEKTYTTYNYGRNYTGSSYTPATTKVFVYGTLKRGYKNSHFLKDATYLGKYTTTSKYAMIGKDMSFPYLLKLDPTNGHKIVGEVYEVNAETLAKLDRLEGVPTHYRKEAIMVNSLADSRYITTITYIKATVLKSDLEKEYIAEYTEEVPARITTTDFSSYTLDTIPAYTDSELWQMSTFSLKAYLLALETLVYGKEYSKGHYFTKDELLDEISDIYQTIQAMYGVSDTPTIDGYLELLATQSDD